MAVIRSNVITSVGIGTQCRSATVNASSSGDNNIVSGIAGKTIRVLSYLLIAAAPVTVRWESEDGTLLAGPMAMAANTPLVAPPNPEGYFQTVTSGDDLHLNLSGAVAVGGHITYTVISLT